MSMPPPPPPPPPPSSPGGGQPSFAIGEVLRRGWAAFTGRWIDFLVIGVAAGVIVGVVSWLVNLGDVTLVGVAVVALISIAVAVLASLAQTKLALACVDGDRTPLGGLVNQALPRAGSYIGWNLLAGLIIFAGLLLCLLPGLVAAFFLMFVPFLAIEGRADNPLQGSFAAVKEQAGNLILLFFVFFGIALAVNLVGAVLSVIPLIGNIIAQAISYVLFGFVICTLAVVYRASAIGRVPA